jgi:LysM repeat protein
MMKKIFFLLFLLPLFAVAQKTKTHTVGPKESLTSIGRLYNINGRELANYNKIDYDKGLTLGQVLKIPGQNAPVKVAVATPVKVEPVVKAEGPVKVANTSNKNGTPIYHTVAKQETLYRISTMYNKVPVADIKKWNNLTSDALSEGTKLIVGYSGKKNTTETAVVKEPAKEVVEIEKPKKEDSPRIKTAGEEEINTKAKEEKKEMPQPKTPVVAPVSNAKVKNFNGGFFKNIFDDQTNGKQLVKESGTGGVFKSTSGWEDGKYYCLHNTATAGTIVMVTNIATSKAVYAKVLDMIPDIKQNAGLIIRISNAAADALGATADSKLDCTINYSK